MVWVHLLLGWNTYLLFNSDIVNFVWKTDGREAESIVWLIVVLWPCFNCRWVRVCGVRQRVVFIKIRARFFYFQIWFKCETPLIFFSNKNHGLHKKLFIEKKRFSVDYVKIIELHTVRAWRHMFLSLCVFISIENIGLTYSFKYLWSINCLLFSKYAILSNYCLVTIMKKFVQLKLRFHWFRSP